MRFVTKALLTLVLVVTGSLCVFAESGIVLVDASGSMTGFFTTGSIQNLHNELASALRASSLDVRSYAFKHRVIGGKVITETEPFSTSVSANGGVTLIDKAYTKARSDHPASGIVWVVTDNVQDPLVSGTEIDDIEQFYKSIEHDEQIYRVYFFIRPMDFAGPLYREGGKAKLAENYRGKRSVIIYAILLNSNLQDAFDRAAQSFAKGGSAPTLVKGLNSAAINMVDNQQLTRKAEENIPSERRMVLRDKTLSTTPNQVFGENDPIHASFVIGFESHAENIKISQPGIRAEIIQKFGEGSEDVLQVQPKIAVTPERLPGTLLPATETPEDQRAWVQVDIDFPQGIQFSHTPGAMWRNIFRRSGGRYEGTIKVGVLATKSAFDFSPKMIQDYNAGPEYFTQANEAAQTRVPHLDSLFRRLNRRESEEVEIVTQPFKISLPLRYPRYPLAILILLIAGFAALGYAVARSARTSGYGLETLSPRHYRLVKQAKPRAQSSPRKSLDSAFGAGPERVLENHAAPLRLAWFGHHTIREEEQVLGVIRRRWGMSVEADRGFLVNGKQRLQLSQGQSFSFTERLPDTPAPASAGSFQKPNTHKSGGRNVPESGF